MQNHKHPQYSSGQIREYLRHLSPSSKLTWLQESRGPEDDLHHLTVLHKFQLATVPFENLSLHYSPDHDVSLDPEQLYEKFVTHGRGGYCMENNAFFNAVLKGLKFSVYSTGARVSDATAGISGGGYGGW
jgi:arylamine N-acetyltransferase